MKFLNIVIILAAIAIILFLVSQMDFSPSTTFTNAELAGNSPSEGAADAKVTIVEFSDYQCPACLSLEQGIRQVLPDYKGKVLLVYRNYPLYSIHPNAGIAAEAALAANEQGKFWEMHNALFDNQEQIKAVGKPAINGIALQLGLDINKFDDALLSRKFAPAVQKDMADAEKFGVNATPIFFINGKKFIGAYGAAQLRQFIDAELK